MPSAQATRWSQYKTKLDAETLKTLAKKKLDLGKSLDAFDKYSTLVTKELGTGQATKKASAAMDELRKLKTRIDKARTDYTVIVDEANKAFNKVGKKNEAAAAGNAKMILRGIGNDIETELKLQVAAYGDVAQRRTDITLATVFGDDWVSLIPKLKFASTADFNTFAAHPSFTLSPADWTTIDPGLSHSQREFADGHKSAVKAYKVLKESMTKKFPNQKEAFLFARKVSDILANGYAVPNGSITKLTEWRMTFDQLGRNTDYKTTQQYKAVTKTFDAITKVWQQDEEHINRLFDTVDRKRF